MTVDIFASAPFGSGWENRGVLGSGSYGTVYLVEKTSLGHTYQAAIKHIRIPPSEEERALLYTSGDITSPADEQTYVTTCIQEISQEIDAIYGLKGHTNIVSYEDHRIIPHVGAGMCGYDILIKMEYLTSLSRYMMDHGLTLDQVLRLGIDMCAALMLLQKKQLIHRDIKPDNIFINRENDFKLGDFGVARILHESHGYLTQKGTDEYMAPELRLNQKCSNMVDIYSLGIVLYRMLNLNRGPFLPLPPEFPTSTQRTIAFQKRFGGEPFPPPAKADHVLSSMVQKACAFQPEARWESAAAFRNALQNYRCTLSPDLLSANVFEGLEREFVPQSSAPRYETETDRTRLLRSEPSNHSTGSVQTAVPSIVIGRRTANSVKHQTGVNSWFVLAGASALASLILLVLCILMLTRPSASVHSPCPVLPHQLAVTERVSQPETPPDIGMYPERP